MRRRGHVHSRTNQYDSMRTRGYRKPLMATVLYRDNGSSEVPKGIRDSEHRQCKCLFYFHFERSGGSWSTNSSIPPSTLEDHQEPDSGKVQFSKELCCQKKDQ